MSIKDRLLAAVLIVGGVFAVVSFVCFLVMLVVGLFAVFS